MENIFDLDEYSNKEENSDISEEFKDNSPKSHNRMHLSTFNSNSSNFDLTSNKDQTPARQLIISKNNPIYSISNNPINISLFKLNNGYNYENFEINEQNIINKNNKEDQKNALNKYAEEDSIDVSKFDEIKELAMNFKFVLDNFQKRSIIRLEQNKNILVCAHTSSGKTLVAEYGIALGKKKIKKLYIPHLLKP